MRRASSERFPRPHRGERVVAATARRPSFREGPNKSQRTTRIGLWLSASGSSSVRPTLLISLLLLLLLPPATLPANDIVWHCGCETCVDAIWDRRVPGTAATCGALIRQQQRSLALPDACVAVATLHTECAECHNLACVDPAPFYCGCPSCSPTGNDACAVRLDELILAEGFSEWNACLQVADTLPSCGAACHPVACQAALEMEVTPPVGTMNTTESPDPHQDQVLGWTFAAICILMLAVLLLLLRQQ
jgi:hypothetical protein